MRTLCTKPGKIHPSPSGTGGWGNDPIAAAFRLLPAAMLVVAAALRPEDQEVLAHLVTRSLREAAAPPSEQPRVRRRRFREHPPTIGCGCFECYISFWSRWDCSPQSDRIHAALEAYEAHIFAAESSSATTLPSSSKRRDKGKRSRAHPTTPPPPPPPMPRRRPKSPEAQAKVIEQLAALPPSSPFSPPPAPAAYTTAEKEKAPAEPSAEECEVAEAEERKRGWADVMGGVLGLRLWGIWSPAVVESAT